MMTANVSSPTRLFTVREANAALPLVSAITQDMVYVARDIVGRRERLQALLAGRKLLPGNPYDDELAQMRDNLESDAHRIRGYVEELRELGVEAKSATEGLVDFPGILDGRHVYFCWKLGEEEVSYWHEIGASYASRKPLSSPTSRNPSASRTTYLS